MKLSEQTIKILKNFAGINQSILFRPGSMISTISNAKDMVAEATIEEEFPIEFALYDLIEFLNTLKLFRSPIFDFSHSENNYMYICEEDDTSFRVRYTFAKKKTIRYPTNRPVIESVDINFKLDGATRESIIKASNVMQLPHFMVVPSDTPDSVKLEVSDMKDKSSNKFSITIPGTTPPNKNFSLIINMDNFKIFPVEYNVSISGKSVASFESNVVDYYIGLDVNSKF